MGKKLLREEINMTYPTYTAPYCASVPIVLDNTGRNERAWDLWSRLNKDRIVFLGEEVSNISANIIVGQLLYLESENKEEPISLYINSPGGSVSAGLAIYDTMNYIKPDVHTVCVGLAASMGALLLSSGAKGHRSCLPNSEIMCHQPLGGASGQATDIAIQAAHMERTKKKLTKIMAENTGKSYDEVYEALERDNWFTAEEAKDYGLVDTVLTSR